MSDVSKPSRTCVVREKQDASLAAAMKAIGHPARLRIIRQLAERDRCCAGDFCDCIDLAQSTVSQHLEMLRRSGIVSRRQEGTRSIYVLDRALLAGLAGEMVSLAGLPDPLLTGTERNGAAVPQQHKARP